MIDLAFLAALDRMSCGGLVLDTKGDVLSMNTNASRILSTGERACKPETNTEGGRHALKALLAKAGGRFRVDSEAWMTVTTETGAPLVVHAIPLGDGIESGPHTMLVLVDMAQRPLPSASSLQRLFGLTPAEARLAVEISRGRILAEIAKSAKVSNATVRTQLSAVFTKTQTRRQSELVSLLARVALLP